MTKTFELIITCESDDYENYYLQRCIEEIMHTEFDREEVEVELRFMGY